MRDSSDRAVAVVVDRGRLLVIRRHRPGLFYCVLPGGGVEPGESPRRAALRELLEETGLPGVVRRPLATLEHSDRTAHYLLVDVEPGALTLGGPEADEQSEHNRHSPEWIGLDDVVAENLQPADVRPLLDDLS